MPIEIMLLLHVWPPGFGLPSIDAQCLSTIAYFKHAVPDQDWQLTATSDPGLLPCNELPALLHHGIWVAGFRNIVNYLADQSSGDWNLDAGLPGHAQADCIAFSAYIQTHAQPLIDLYLYVSSTNYAATRSIFPHIQPFPLPYITPTALRTAAKARTAHLGLISLDIDDSEESGASSRSHASQSVFQGHDASRAAVQNLVPASLRRQIRHTVTSALASSPEVGAQIRLHALAEDFFRTVRGTLKLDSMTKDRDHSSRHATPRYLVSHDRVSTLDCLAIGYLSLMLMPRVPHPWLSKILKDQYPDLCQWMQEMAALTFGIYDTTSEGNTFEAVSPVYDRTSHGGQSSRGSYNAPLDKNLDIVDAEAERQLSILPWRLSERPALASIIRLVVFSTLSAVPGFRHMSANLYGGRQAYSAKKPPSSNQGSSILKAVFLTTAGAAIGMGYLLFRGDINFPMSSFTTHESTLRRTGEPEREDVVLGDNATTRDYGAAGDVLGLHHLRAPSEDQMAHEPVVEVEVEVEVDGVKDAARVSS